MKSLLCHGPGVRSYEEKFMPTIEKSADAFVRITRTTMTTQMLLKTVVSGKPQPKQLITHHFTLDEVVRAYDTFDNDMKEEALKVIVTNGVMMGEVMPASAAFGIAMLEEQSLMQELTANDSLGG